MDLICPSCGLTIRPRAPWLAVVHCPRCLARKRALVELTSGSPDAKRSRRDDEGEGDKPAADPPPGQAYRSSMT